MPDWKDEDEYLTYLAKVFRAVYDERPAAAERLRDYTHGNWIALFLEGISENEDAWLWECYELYVARNWGGLGQKIGDSVEQYIAACAIAHDVIDEGDLDD